VSKSRNISEKARILIVDDDASMRKLMKAFLVEGNYTITEADNGADALAAIKKEEPDMVLLDVNMPGMSGFEVCAEIRKQSGDTNISVVMVTALDDSASIEKAFQLGATAFVNKPINWVTFHHQMMYLLKARSAFVELQQSETHLDYMERVSLILTQNKDTDTMLQKLMLEMVDIFDADRAFIIDTQDFEPTNLISETSRDDFPSIKSYSKKLVDKMVQDISLQTKKRDWPQVISYGSSKSAGHFSRKLLIHHQILIALQLNVGRSCFLVLQKCTASTPWSPSEQETFHDISTRLSAVLSHYLLMEQLHHNEYLLRQAQQIGHLGNWSWDVKTNLLSWSDEIYRIYGYEPGSFTPTYDKFYKIVYEEDRGRLKQFRQTAFKTNDTQSIEHRITLPSGEIRWVHAQGIGTFDEKGDLTEINGTVQDITDRLKKQEQEVHDHKMDAIGQLTSGITHDFGNLMTVAKGNLELLDEILTEQYNIDNDDKEILSDAQSAIQDGVELTKQLLAFSRKKSIAQDYVNVGATIKSFSKLIKNSLGDKITLSIKIQKNLPDILVDSTQFESSLLNVAINARDAMPKGGRLTFHAEVAQPSPEEISQNTDNDIENQYICISVTDTGTGMTDNVLQHAIEPFFTTKNNEGTGLGLSMVYGFMRQSKGKLTIDSNPQQGTCLKMQFPIYDGKKTTKSKKPSLKTTPLSTATVLVVDDRAGVRQFASRCLDKQGFEILEAEDAASAQKILKKNRNIDLLFTDILMPGDINGRELAAWATKKYPQLKVLLTTASEKEAQQGQPTDEQAFQVLPKPYSKQDLIDKICNIL